MDDKGLKFICLLFVFYLFLGLIATYPLVFHMTDHLPENQMGGGFVSYDTLQTFFDFWLFKHNVLEKKPIYSNGFEFSTGSGEDFSGVRSFTGPMRGFPFTILFLALSVLGDVFAYNSLLILSFPLAAVGMYLLVEYLTKNRYAGITAGIVYSISPFRFGEIVLFGHLGGIIAVFLPFLVYFYERSFAEKSLKAMVCAGIFMLFIAFSEWHIMYYVLLFTLLYVPFKLFLHKKEDLGRIITSYLPHLVVLLSFVTMSVGYIMYSRYHTGLTPLGSWSLEGIKTTYIHLIPFYLIKFPENEFYLGVSLLIFVISVLFYFRKQLREADIFFYSLIFTGSAVMALGPIFPTEDFSLYELAYKLLPYFDHFRSPVRILVMAIFSLSILAGFSIKKICEFGKKATARELDIFMSIIVLILSMDLLLAPIGLTPVDPYNQGYLTISADTRDVKVLEIPMLAGGHSVASVYEYYVTVHQKRIINGYYPFPPEEYSQVHGKLKSLDGGTINSTQHSLLKELQVGYVVVHENLFSYFGTQDDASVCIKSLQESEYLEFIGKDGHVWVFAVK